MPAAVLVAMNAEAPPATRAEALSAVMLPVADTEAAVTAPVAATVVAAREVTEVAAPKVPVTVTVPVEALIETV